MNDAIIDSVLAKGIHADAKRRHALFDWVMMKDPPDYAGRVHRRLGDGDTIRRMSWLPTR